MSSQSNQNPLGDTLKQRRLGLHLSIREVARRSNINDANILRIERGDSAQPKPETLRALADALGIDLSDLFALSGYVQPKTLPTFAPYLRSKYADLPESAAREIEASFAAIAAKHGYDPRGPKRGEDEED